MRSRFILLAITFAFSIPSLAHAEGTAIYAGAGPRFSAGDTATVGAVRVTYGVESLLSLAFQLDAYLSGPGLSEPLDFAGGQAGLTVDIPIPGPITPEIGLAVGLVSLIPERHGHDANLLAIHGELALRAALGPVRIRAAWTAPLWAENDPLTTRALDSQLVFSLGVGF